MKFYGIASEERALEIVENLKGDRWVFVDNQSKEKLEMNLNQAKEKLKEVINEVKSWKKSSKLIPAYTVLIFVHEPQEPKVFKIYDTSSLGCSTSLSPPRWMVYLKDIENEL